MQVTCSAGVYGSASLPVQKEPVFQQGGRIRLPHSCAYVSVSSSSCKDSERELDQDYCACILLQQGGLVRLTHSGTYVSVSSNS